jgi:predicted metalloprotease with PDZ domain
MKRLALILSALCIPAVAAAERSVTLEVDATEATSRILHARLVIPATPGPLTLVYPKWIPGEHAPSGPIVNLAGLRFTAEGAPLAWERDPADLYSFRLTVPRGAHAIEVKLDYVSPTEGGAWGSGLNATEKLVVLNWNTVLLYPRGTRADEIRYAASVRLPSGWKYATALSPGRDADGSAAFLPVSLLTLIDSPLIAGEHLRRVKLQEAPLHEIDFVADNEEALEFPPELLDKYQSLVSEAGALFGSHPYRSYRWLVSLSNALGGGGVEHHESSDDRLRERSLLEADRRPDLAGLLSHEFVHSWNGKYRRPAGLMIAPDYGATMTTETVWFYEGLTQYLMFVLSSRAGLWSPDDLHERLASVAAGAGAQKGRDWRPLGDTASSAQLLYRASPQWSSWRRSYDFYNESVLIWLEADAIIRDQTQGKRSLDDFCRKFFGGQDGSPAEKSYIEADIIKALAEVVPYDWAAFIDKRIHRIAETAPLDGLASDGWKLTYSEKPNDAWKGDPDSFTGWLYSLGLRMKSDGSVVDVVPGTPAARAGVAPAMKVVAVNSRRFAPDVANAAVKRAGASGASGTIELIVENMDQFKVLRVEYRDGLRYPHLERDEKRPDRLQEVVRPLVVRPAPTPTATPALAPSK